VRSLRYAIRGLAKSPTLVVVATLSLALGIGVNTALYSVFRSVFLQPPTAVAPERLVRIEPGNSNQISYLNFRDLQSGSTFDGLAAYAMVRLNLRSGDRVERVAGLMVSPAFFDVLGVRPAMGRLFSSPTEPAAVITYEYWRRRLSDGPDPIGVVLHLNGHPFTVIGVLPAGYRSVAGALGPDLYVPIGESLVPAAGRRRQSFLTLLARLGGGVSARQAEAAVTSQLQALERMYPEENVDLGRQSFVFPVSGLGSWRTRDVGTGSLMALTAAPFALFGLVLLIACANVAGLLLARGSARRREIAIRLALGASRWRVISTVLAESLVLSALGSAAALLLTFWLCGLVASIPLPQAPGPLTVTPDLGVVGFALVLAFVATVAAGLMPAMALTSPRLTEALSRESAVHGRRVTARSVLVSGQVALATLLLFVSLLLLRSLTAITGVDTGFDLDRIVTARIELDGDRYSGDERSVFAARAMQTVQALPGVASASVSNLIPLGGDMYSRVYEVENKTLARTETYTMNVGAGYFRTMGIRLRRGREFTAADRAGAQALAIVNEAFVRTHGLDSEPLGSRARSGESEPWLEIVGVAADSKYAFFGETARPILYRPFLQAGGGLVVIARTSVAPASMVAALRRALVDMDGSALVESQTMRDATSLEFTIRRFAASLLGAIGTLGLGLALTGLYGLMSYSVSQRAREIGIRMALGASRWMIQWMVLRSALRLVGLGVGFGTAISLIAVRPLAFLMSGVPVADPWTIAGCAALFLSAGLAASYTPSLKATRVDPMVTLKTE
jgi:putative ABC transport system permease protein